MNWCVLDNTDNDIELPINWWEPGTPGVFDIGDLGAFLAALLAFAAVFAAISRWWMKSLRSVVKEEIEIATQPIHPHGNGGLSLADVARKTTDLEKNLKSMHRYNQETRNILLKALTGSIDIPDELPEEEVRLKTTRSRKKS